MGDAERGQGQSRSSLLSRISPAGRGPKVQALDNLSIEAINADNLTKSQWSASNGAKELD